LDWQENTDTKHLYFCWQGNGEKSTEMQQLTWYENRGTRIPWEGVREIETYQISKETVKKISLTVASVQNTLGGWAGMDMRNIATVRVVSFTDAPLDQTRTTTRLTGVSRVSVREKRSTINVQHLCVFVEFANFYKHY
jgi:hypothetical protein